MKTLTLLTLVSLFLAGCSTQHSVEKLRGKGKGMVEVFDVPYPRLFPIVVESCKTSELRPITVNAETGYIFAGSEVRMESWGENVAVWVSPITTNRTEVEVVSSPVGPSIFFFINWEEAILTNIRASLEAEKAKLVTGQNLE